MTDELAHGPQSSMTENWSQIYLQCFKEIFMVESKNAVKHVVDADSEHPDLLIVDETTRLMVESILTKRGAEIILHLSNTSLVHVHNIILLRLILSINVQTLLFEEDWSQFFKIIFEIFNSIIEKGCAI